MTTQGVTATDKWVDIVSELSLVVGTPYTLQNTGRSEIRLVEKATAPAASDFFHVIMPNGFQLDVTPETGLGLWVQSASGESKIAITEV
ncbi:hypothetical protein KAR91_69495 [Candidatus Pacearchaeota archaeon]|nr:hypothetical protein [Candidatus Pacearchaeota archaeon]